MVIPVTRNKTRSAGKRKHKGKNAHETPSRRTELGLHFNLASQVKEEIRWTVIRRTWVAFWKLLPHIFWTLYIEACVVAAFRYEWKEKYRHWNVWLELNQRSNQVYPYVIQVKESKSKQLPRDSFGSIHSATSKTPRSHNHNECSRIRMNVGGRIYETQLRTLHRFPQSLLGDPHRRLPFYDPVKEYYYFDRNRDCFENILYYYQSGGRLVCPTGITPDTFLNEIEFYDLGVETIRTFQLEEGLEQEDDSSSYKLPKNLFQRKLWLLLEYPTSSPQATIVSIVSVYVVLISVIVFCIETEPMFKTRDGYWYQMNNASEDDEYVDVDVRDPLSNIETICIIWFTSELVLRFAVCPEKCKFLGDIMNLVDMLAIFPYCVTWVTKIWGPRQPKEAASLAVVRVIRLVRVFRIFKLSRHVKGLKILGWTLQASFNELGLLIFFLLIGVVLFSSALFFAEEGPESKFQSIPEAFFWAVTTMTTVGYGDMVPTHVWGKVIGSLCAITGVLTLALPVPVMVSNFNYFYNQEISRTKSMTDRMEIHHVQMCCFLPGNGNHPLAAEALNESKHRKRKSKKAKVAFSKNPYISESDVSE